MCQDVPAGACILWHLPSPLTADLLPVVGARPKPSSLQEPSLTALGRCARQGRVDRQRNLEAEMGV